jgi:hypothetical protein
MNNDAVGRTLYRYTETGTVEDLHKAGRPRVVDINILRKIQLWKVYFT